MPSNAVALLNILLLNIISVFFQKTKNKETKVNVKIVFIFILWLLFPRESGNDFCFPDIASYTGRFRLILVRISSVISLWVDIRRLSLFLICCLFSFYLDATFGFVPVSILMKRKLKSLSDPAISIFWSEDLYRCSGYSMYNSKGKTFPLPFL